MVRVRIDSEKLKNILCYPEYSDECYYERLKELDELGVKYILLEGGKVLFGNIHVLGKGYASVVLKAETCDGDIVTLKVRRTDSRRKSMENEAICLAIANTVNVGPQILGFTENILMYRFIEGRTLDTWFKGISEPNVIRSVIVDILRQCFRLDLAPLDHGELNRPHKHVIVDKRNRPYIIDFESASYVRKPANLSSAVSFFFIRKNMISNMLREILRYDVNDVLESIRKYKRTYEAKYFLALLRAAKLI